MIATWPSWTGTSPRTTAPRCPGTIPRKTIPILPGNWSDSVGVNNYRYTQAIKNDNISLQFFDDWTTNFSTEAKIGYQHFVQDTQFAGTGTADQRFG